MRLRLAFTTKPLQVNTQKGIPKLQFWIKLNTVYFTCAVYSVLHVGHAYIIITFHYWFAIYLKGEIIGSGHIRYNVDQRDSKVCLNNVDNTEGISCQLLKGGYQEVPKMSLSCPNTLDTLDSLDSPDTFEYPWYPHHSLW